MKAIVAVDEQWGIGKKGKLLFSIHKDLKQFKNRTKGNTIILGSRTLQTFPHAKALPERKNVVLSHGKVMDEQVIWVKNLAELFRETGKGDDVFVIGGGMVFDELLDYCDTAYVTKVYDNFDADTFFPNLDMDDDWMLCEESEREEEDGLVFSFCTYTKKS